MISLESMNKLMLDKKFKLEFKDVIISKKNIKVKCKYSINSDRDFTFVVSIIKKPEFTHYLDVNIIKGKNIVENKIIKLAIQYLCETILKDLCETILKEKNNIEDNEEFILKHVFS